VRLLVIDDDPDIWAMVEAFSEEHPHVDLVGTAATPEEGLALTREANPDAILLDHSFPPREVAPQPWDRILHGMSGLEAVEYLRAAAPQAVIALFTGVSGLQRSVEHSGADMYVMKGIDLRDVFDNMAYRALERRRT
jgi:DNA-binding NarL/FixJ family response regulator